MIGYLVLEIGEVRKPASKVRARLSDSLAASPRFLRILNRRTYSIAPGPNPILGPKPGTRQSCLQAARFEVAYMDFRHYIPPCRQAFAVRPGIAGRQIQDPFRFEQAARVLKNRHRICDMLDHLKHRDHVKLATLSRELILVKTGMPNLRLWSTIQPRSNPTASAIPCSRR